MEHRTGYRRVDGASSRLGSGWQSAEQATGDALDADLKAVETVTGIATDHGAAPGQVALAWLLAKAPDVVPIPGTPHVSRLEENTAAAGLAATLIPCRDGHPSQ